MFYKILKYGALLFIIQISNLIFVKCLADYDQIEYADCYGIKPSVYTDCTKQKAISLFCCYFNMTTPDKGQICVPMPPSSKGIGETLIDTTLPVNVLVKGTMNCKPPS
jgi:hypothetical protein